LSQAATVAYIFMRLYRTKPPEGRERVRQLYLTAVLVLGAFIVDVVG